MEIHLQVLQTIRLLNGWTSGLRRCFTLEIPQTKVNFNIISVIVPDELIGAATSVCFI